VQELSVTGGGVVSASGVTNTGAETVTSVTTSRGRNAVLTKLSSAKAIAAAATRWQWLVVGAARKSERRGLPVNQVALEVANLALLGAEVDPHRDWSETYASHARTSMQPAQSLRQALEVLPLEARRNRVRSAAVVEEAKARLTRALARL
jgi:hypothetical protein